MNQLIRRKKFRIVVRLQMLIGFDHNQPLYVIGTSIQAEEIRSMIGEEIGDHKAILVPHDRAFRLPTESYCVLGFMNLVYRMNFLEHIDRFHWPTWISDKNQSIGTQKIGQGCVLYPHSVVMHGAQIGSFNHVGPMAFIAHGCITGSNVVIAPGCIIGGSSTIGNNVFMGQRSAIKDKIQICSNIWLGMSSTVHKSISASGQYIGNKKIHDFEHNNSVDAQEL